jgi:hypothetical protein
MPMETTDAGSRAAQVEITLPGWSPRDRKQDETQATPPARLPRITRLMALAIKFQDMVDRGEVRDYADIARLGYVTRARITQIMNLLHLAPEVQEEILFLKCVPSERSMRPLTVQPLWGRQLRIWRRLKAENQINASFASDPDSTAAPAHIAAGGGFQMRANAQRQATTTITGTGGLPLLGAL